ncbi:hypothetical protein C4573_04670 [Candidatus Woesearchaeota archaeon]|nr:MAG: hypothetical protein C4573_04670 [Candidatus Woesearchaeota archaeon]
MRAFINAYGAKDSLGNDRVSEIRGLLHFGGKPVIQHTLERLADINITPPVLVYVNKEHEQSYRAMLSQTPVPVDIQVPSGPTDPVNMYVSGLSQLGIDEHALILADDNLFDFSLAGLLKEMERVQSNAVAVRHFSGFPSGKFNFATCNLQGGRLIDGSYSFANPGTEHPFVILDIYGVHKQHIPGFVRYKGPNAPPIEQLAREWFKDFHAWLPKGFWADIGKPVLRQKAEEYFKKLF